MNKVEKGERIFTTYIGDSSKVFPKILDLHVQKGSRILDATHGKGIFWKDVEESKYDLVKSDIESDKSPYGESVDCRNLPFLLSKVLFLLIPYELLFQPQSTY